MNRLIYLLCLLFIFKTDISLAWGGRGHDSICQAAVHLVKNDELKQFLMLRPHIMGHLCNVPDIYWKSLGKDSTQIGNSTHYINGEVIGLPIKSIPLVYKDIEAKYASLNSKIDDKPFYNFGTQLGSNWWRADQFKRLAIKSGVESAKDNFEKNIFDMMTAMGLMGHFIGDNAQPYHLTANYDGYNNGHGGIHSYYEEKCVSAFGPDLQAKIIKSAKKITKKPFLQSSNLIENMRALGSLSSEEIKDIEKMDPVIQPSVIKLEKGMSFKSPATRKPADEGLKKFEKLILNQMGRAALLLAFTWDDIYAQAGKPGLSKYASFDYPLQPAFVTPDYINTAKK